mgnify:FL=1
MKLGDVVKHRLDSDMIGVVLKINHDSGGLVMLTNKSKIFRTNIWSVYVSN